MRQLSTGPQAPSLKAWLMNCKALLTRKSLLHMRLMLTRLRPASSTLVLNMKMLSRGRYRITFMYADDPQGLKEGRWDRKL